MQQQQQHTASSSARRRPVIYTVLKNGDHAYSGAYVVRRTPHSEFWNSFGLFDTYFFIGTVIQMGMQLF
jgi:hypothetical protein